MTSDLMQAIQANLLSLAVLFFLLGVFTTLSKIDLRFARVVVSGADDRLADSDWGQRGCGRP